MSVIAQQTVISLWRILTFGYVNTATLLLMAVTNWLGTRLFCRKVKTIELALMWLFFTTDLVSVQLSLSVCPTARFGSSGFISEMGLREKTRSRSAQALHCYCFNNSLIVYFIYQGCNCSFTVEVRACDQFLLDLVCQGIQFTGFIL